MTQIPDRAHNAARLRDETMASLREQMQQSDRELIVLTRDQAQGLIDGHDFAMSLRPALLEILRENNLE